MGKDIGRIYKHIQSQPRTTSINAPVSLSEDTQTFSAIKLTTMSIPSMTDKHQKNSVLCSQNTIQNDATITNNDDIQYCEIFYLKVFKPFQHLIIIHNVFLPYPHVH